MLDAVGRETRRRRTFRSRQTEEKGTPTLVKMLPAALVRIVLVTSQPIVPGQQCSMNVDALCVRVL